MNEQLLKRVLGTPPERAVSGSRRRVERWFAQTARLVRWDVMQSPLGPLYLAAGDQGLGQGGLDLARTTDGPDTGRCHALLLKRADGSPAPRHKVNPGGGRNKRRNR